MLPLTGRKLQHLLCPSHHLANSLFKCILNMLFLFSFTFPDKDRPPPYIPPAPSEDEAEIFKTIHKGINFDKYEKIPVVIYKYIHTVLPDPVCAHAIKSRPDITIGMEYFCTGVGLS
jgi:hypothetical protein